MDGGLILRAQRIEDLHAEARKRAHSAVEAAIECGRELIRAKDDLQEADQGELFDQFACGLSFGSEQASRYVKAAVMVESNPDALYALDVRQLFVPERKDPKVSYYEARVQLLDWKEIGLDFRRKGWTQQDVAVRLNVSRSTVKGWFNDGSPPIVDDAIPLIVLYEQVTGKDLFAPLKQKCIANMASTAALVA